MKLLPNLLKDPSSLFQHKIPPLCCYFWWVSINTSCKVVLLTHKKTLLWVAATAGKGGLSWQYPRWISMTLPWSYYAIAANWLLFTAVSWLPKGGLDKQGLFSRWKAHPLPASDSPCFGARLQRVSLATDASSSGHRAIDSSAAHSTLLGRLNSRLNRDDW